MKTEHRRQNTEDRSWFVRKVFLIVVLTASSALLAQGTVDFNDYFIDKTMRVDFYMTGNFNEETITIDQTYETDGWAGNPKKTIDTRNNGPFYVKIYSINSNELIFSKGFGCIFAEYKTTKPARSGTKKTYLESAIIPCPKKPVLFVVESRDRKNILHPIYNEKIDPSDANIIKEKAAGDIKVFDVLKNGDPHSKVDFVFVSEGYTEGQFEKFQKDVNHFAEVLFKVEPYKSNKEKFNIYGAFYPSSEEGVDEPRQGKFRRTAVSASYNALGLDRYLLVNDTKTMRDIAGAAPYDSIIVLANTKRYGGGGIYNNYTIFTSDNNRSEEIFLHEFGHGFGGLADEYFSADVAYEDFFAADVEPLEGNITALLDPNNVKWKHLLSPGIPIPTPWGQEETAELGTQRNKIREQLKAKDISEDKRKELEDNNRQIREQIRNIRSKYEELYKGKVGVFEGAGYQAKGLYRSEINIGGFDTKTFKYGPVIEEIIQKAINNYAD